jgi:hypothetical protein
MLTALDGDYYLFDADSHIEKKLKTAQIADPPTGVFYTHIPNVTAVTILLTR